MAVCADDFLGFWPNFCVTLLVQGSGSGDREPPAAWTLGEEHTGWGTSWAQVTDCTGHGLACHQVLLFQNLAGTGVPVR